MLRHISISEELNWKVKDPDLITGIADPIQIYVTHIVYPSYSMAVFAVKIYNLTKFEISDVRVNILLSKTLSFCANQSPQFVLPNLSTKAVWEGKVRAIITSPGLISVSASVVFDNVEDQDTITIHSLPYKAPYCSLFLKDISSNGSVQRFIHLWTRLTHNITFQCMLTAPKEILRKEISRYMHEVDFHEEQLNFRMCFQAVTVQGDRIALLLSGNNKHVRVELRSNSSESMQPISANIENFLCDLSNSCLIST